MIETVVYNKNTGEFIMEDKIIKWDKDKNKSGKFIEKQQDKTEFGRFLNCKEFGYYNHMFFNKFDYSEKQYIVRLMLLGAYADYDGYMVKDLRNKRDRQYIKSTELMELLDLKDREYKNTKKYLVDNGLITIDKNKKVIINKKYVSKGEVKMSNKEFQKLENDYIRVFDETIKNIYSQSKPKEHKRLGLLFQILPYINAEHNIICTLDTVNEINKDDVKPLTMKELCLLVGYDVNNSTRLRKDLFNITIDDELIIGIFMDGSGKTIVTNPRLFYKGSDLYNLKGVRGLFGKKKK